MCIGMVGQCLLCICGSILYSLSPNGKNILVDK